MSKRLSKPYQSGRSGHWLKVKNPDGPAMASGRPVGQLYVAEIKPYHYASVFEEGAAVIVTPPSHSGKLPRQF